MVMEEEFTPPTPGELELKAGTFMRENRPQEYKRLKKAGKLAKFIENRAKAAQDFAQNLIQSGEHPGPAWNRAIRQEILESESD